MQIDGALGGSCTGGAPDFSITGAVGTTLITVQGVDLPATSSCTITVPVIGMAPNNYHNVTGPPGSDETGLGTPADAYLIVADDLSMHKEIAPSPIQIGQTATLTFTILNPYSFDLVNVRFFETLPVGNLGAGQMEVADPPNASTTNCGAPTWNPLAGDIDLTFSGGTIPAGTACVVQVDVTGSASDTYVNQVDPAGGVDYFDGENATTGAAVAGTPSNPATLVITNPPPQASSGPAGLTAPTPTATPEFPDILPSTGGQPAVGFIDSWRRMALLGGLSVLVIGFSLLLMLRVRRR